MKIERWYQGERLVAGTFRCPPGDAAWRKPNNIGQGAHVVFPRTTVLIEQEGSRPIFTTPNEAVLYDEGRDYRRGLVDERGDDCTWIQVAPSLMSEISATSSLRVFDPQGATFTTPQVPIARSLYLAQLNLFTALRRGETTIDPLSVEEALLRLVAGAITERSVGVSGVRSSTQRARRDLVEEAKRILGRALHETPTLESVARSLHVSPFYLARTFREVTGSSMHRYLLELRLRRALVLLAESGLSVAEIATAVGFSTHSHFTSWFSRMNGCPPTRFAVRQRWRQAPA